MISIGLYLVGVVFLSLAFGAQSGRKWTQAGKAFSVGLSMMTEHPVSYWQHFNNVRFRNCLTLTSLSVILQIVLAEQHPGTLSP